MSLARRGFPRLVGTLSVNTELGAFLGDTRIRLLEGIGRHGSIARAAKSVPMSYKTAWDALDAMNNLTDSPLVESSVGGRHGGGTHLTDYVRRLIALYRAVEQEYQQAVDRLARGMDAAETAEPHEFESLLRRLSMRTSARNQLVGTLVSLEAGEVNAQVVLRLDAHTTITAAVTRDSVELLGLKPGVEVHALVKASAVTLCTDPGPPTAALNQLWGQVSRIHEGAVETEGTATGLLTTVTATVELAKTPEGIWS